jgi:hypothetical protein
MQRTEDEILSRAPIKCTLGGTEYSIRPLAVMAQREWRKKLFDSLAPILEAFDVTIDPASMSTAKVMSKGLTATLLQFPEVLVDLVFAYAPGLPQDDIMDRQNGATEEQFAVAFSKIAAVAFPFLPQLDAVTRIVRETSLPQQR